MSMLFHAYDHYQCQSLEVNLAAPIIPLTVANGVAKMWGQVLRRSNTLHSPRLCSDKDALTCSLSAGQKWKSEIELAVKRYLGLR